MNADFINAFKKEIQNKTYNQLAEYATYFQPEYGSKPCKELYDYIMDLMIIKLKE